MQAWGIVRLVQIFMLSLQMVSNFLRISYQEHIKNSIPYSLALRLSRIYSPEKDFKGHVDRLKEWFLARDYPENVVNQLINVHVFVKGQPSRINPQNGIRFVVTYHPKVSNFES